MARRADASLAAILLTQRLVDAAGEPLRAREYWALLDQVDDPGSLLGRSVDDLTQELGAAELAARSSLRFEPRPRWRSSSRSSSRPASG